MRILIADDDPLLRLIIRSMLDKCGHQVVEAVDGAEAWTVLEQADPPRLAILDWMMPAIEGVELCRRARLRETDRPPYLILLTTRGGKTDISTGLRAGADDYLSKPFDLQELSARIEVGGRMIALQDRLANNNQQLRESLAQIKTLRGIVPICASCKNIRDDKGFWNRVEAYVSAHSEAQFSHGLCPECAPKFFPGLMIPPPKTGG